jgi:SsrA-binding protein
MSKAKNASKNSQGEEKKNAPTIQNRRALHDFQILKKIEAGIELKGSEVKSCRQGKVQLVDSFAIFEKGELFLHKAHISEYKQSGPHFNHVPTRKRKLLLHRSELRKLEQELKVASTTLVPLKIYFSKGNVKVEIALAKGKNKGDKREALKKKEETRSLAQAKKQAQRE